MPSISHICAGHQFRYDIATGDVFNNYGTHVAALRFCALTGIALMYRVTPHWPAIWAGVDSPFAQLRKIDCESTEAPFTAAELAKFAIGQTAVNIPQER